MKKDFTAIDLMGATIQKLKLSRYVSKSENWLELSILCEVTIHENPEASIVECFQIIETKFKPRLS